jgi:hypothetical protein
MARPGCPIPWAFIGLPIPWAAGAIGLYSAGRGYLMSRGVGCPTIMAAGIAAQPMDGVGFQDRLSHSTSGLQGWWRSIVDPVGFPGAR